MDAVDELDGVNESSKQRPKGLRVITEFFVPIWAELALEAEKMTG